MQDDVADIGFCTVFATLRCSIRETHLHVSSLVPGSTGGRGGRHHKDAAIADPAAIAIFVPHWCWDDTHMQEPLLREAFSSYLVAGAKFWRATTTLVESQRVTTPMRVSWTSHY